MIAKNERKVKGFSNLFLAGRFDEAENFADARLYCVMLPNRDEVALKYIVERSNKIYLKFYLKEVRNRQNYVIEDYDKTAERIDIIENDDDTVTFKDKANEIDVTCSYIEVRVYEMIDESGSKKMRDDFMKKCLKIQEGRLRDIEQRVKKREKGFPLRRDDSYNGIKTDDWIIYKLPDLERDGVRYEFLIELDKWNTSYGIYYGVKCIVKDGIKNEMLLRLNDEWDRIKRDVCQILNNTFRDKKFDARFKLNDNASDGTYWPFWITLYEDENAMEVALRVLIILRAEYEKMLKGINYSDRTLRYVVTDVKIKDGEQHSVTSFTAEAYEEVMENLVKKNLGELEGGAKKVLIHRPDYNKPLRKALERWIKKAEDDGRLIGAGYEKGWMLNMSNVDFAVYMKSLFEQVMRNTIIEAMMKKKNYSREDAENEEYMKYTWKKEDKFMSPPWQNLCRIFLYKNNNGDIVPINESIKNQIKQFENRYDYESLKKQIDSEIQEIINEKETLENIDMG